MKRLIFVVLVLISLQSFGQPTNYTWYRQRTRQYSFMADTALYVPRYNGTPSGVRAGEVSTIDGMVAMDTTNNRFYIYSGGAWVRVANYSEISGQYVDSVWRVAGKDSVFWSKGGTTYQFKDSTGGTVTTRDRFGYSGEDTRAGENRTFSGANSYYVRLDSAFFAVRGVYGTGSGITNYNNAQMFFDPKKSAFRAGYDDANNWWAANVGDYSGAIGYKVKASGSGSFSFGYLSTATGTYATAGGYAATASGDWSISMGSSAVASASETIALGGSTASYLYAIGIGKSNNSKALGSTVVGFSSRGEGDASNTIGSYLVNKWYGSTVVGLYNDTAAFSGTSAVAWDADNPAFLVGNGTGDGTRSNAFVVMQDGKSGFGAVGVPTATLHVAGGFRYVDGLQASGYVLTSDASGNATWQAPTGGGGWGTTGTVATLTGTSTLNLGAGPYTFNIGTGSSGQPKIFANSDGSVGFQNSSGVATVYTAGDSTHIKGSIVKVTPTTRTILSTSDIRLPDIGAGKQLKTLYWNSSTGVITYGDTTVTGSLLIKTSPGYPIATPSGDDVTLKSVVNGTNISWASTDTTLTPSFNITVDVVPQNSAVNIGAQATPFKDLWLYGSGTYGSHSMKFTGTPTGHRVFTFPDATTTIVGTDVTQTLTNKRWTPRVGSTTSSATPTINTDNYDIYKLTAQTADITSFTTNLSGTPVDGDILEIQITGTAARAITWGSSFVATTVALPTTTVTTATLTVVFQYYTTSSYGNNKWHCVNSY